MPRALLTYVVPLALIVVLIVLVLIIRASQQGSLHPNANIA